MMDVALITKTTANVVRYIYVSKYSKVLKICQILHVLTVKNRVLRNTLWTLRHPSY